MRGARYTLAALAAVVVLWQLIVTLTGVPSYILPSVGKVLASFAYNWALIGTLSFEIGFLVDKLTAVMLVVVNFVSLMVHIYTIGYMSGDKGYKRFFCYISLFTFAMHMLVMSNNFLQLFFGWEAVGVVS